MSMRTDLFKTELKELLDKHNCSIDPEIEYYPYDETPHPVLEVLFYKTETDPREDVTLRSHDL